ncbi:MAG TPA: rod shape-determining protein MreC, partial [Actinomycetota bacterium]|nr:rod shape-determining protein MreC [Actinomycetota bacterium]
EGLVGKILRVQEHTATVLLLIDPEGAAAARLTDKTYIGSVKGNGGSENLSLDFIGTRRDVDLYDEVVTAGYDGGIFPPNIPIGVVVKVGGESSDLDQDIQIEPYVDFTSDLDYVLVLLETGPRLESDDNRRREGS